MRNYLPNRRYTETLAFTHTGVSGNRTHFKASIGRYDDGKIGEVFLTAKEGESAMGLICHDAAALISIALQHGATVTELQHAVARYSMDDKRPQSVIGSALDVMAGEETGEPR